MNDNKLLKQSDIGGADWIIEKIFTLFEGIDVSFAIGIGGHAAVGKTTIAEEIVRRRPGSIRLETESCIFDFLTRSRLQMSGCRMEAHDLALYVHYINQLLQGEPVKFRLYDWKTRARTGELIEKRLSHKGILVLDGTIVAHPTIASLCRENIFFIPINYIEWLKFATDRDSSERFRDADTALLENQLKYNDTKSIERTYGSYISNIISVDISNNREFKFTFNKL